MKFSFFPLSISLLLYSGVVLSQVMPPGTYRGTRVCSNGSIPTDTLSKYPVYVKLGEDGSFTSLSNLYKKDEQVCTEMTSGTHKFINNTLVTVSERYEHCGECGNDVINSQPKETKANVEITPKGFILRLFTEYSEGGSCKPGQHMIINFQRVNDYLDNKDLVCEPVPAV